MSRIAQERAALAALEVGGNRPSLVAAVGTLMTEAANAAAFRSHTPNGMHEPTAMIPLSVTRSIIASLSGENLPGLFDASGRLRRTPQAAPSSVVVKMDAAVVANSRVARAGAGVIIMPEAVTPHAVGSKGEILFESVPGYVRNVEAAPWALVNVAALAEVPVSPSPITTVRIDWTQCVAKAVRFEITRKARTAYADQNQLCEQIVAALTLGLARAADETLLSGLTVAALQPFSLGAAAVQDVRFEDLRSLVGTGAAGAVVGQDGVLRAAGVPGELTPDMAGTIVGAWNRAAVAVRDDVNIYFERIGTAGEMAVTAWASMLPLIPVSNKFWAIA